MHSSENSEKLALERFVNYAAPHMKVAIMGRYDPGRTDDLHHAQEILAWAQEIEDDDRPIRNHVKGAVNAVDSDSAGEKTRWALAAHGDAVELDHWILDSGASRQLVRDVSMLEHAVDCNETKWLLLPNGERLQVTKKGTVTLIGIDEGKEFELKLSNVYFAPLLSRKSNCLGY
ncbi:unnamed protein product [Peronospora effusa]|uniref:Retrovirus-related Pol polyprotein from transposon TNT 1-94-like beta-barrel domain-containing protein n=1 Tax=Peronospora effusa TaxID=542832 RepID=A0A3M6VVH0_9STRA|nr:hypothetical protein DD238_000621 [Peronospora effusa]RQM18302.1 hypothetical protein DD237_000048 [Peronospora effusa]CAI5725919.1 unnamed protein product [Peronospora effusa]